MPELSAAVPRTRREARWRPRVGEWVEVRPLSEIMQSLDTEGDSARMPFMPEMLRYAGHRFRVLSSAHKTCDTVNRSGGRRLKDTVHLEELRCDGTAHGGCQAGCLLFWRVEWLRPVTGAGNTEIQSEAGAEAANVAVSLKQKASRVGSTGQAVYRCQATRLFEASEALPWWDARQYWNDVRSGNVGPWQAIKLLVLASIYSLREAGVGYRFFVSLYDTAHRLLTGRPDPFLRGRIPKGQPTPDVRSGLAAGDIVRVRSKAEIESTIDGQNRNRGLRIDVEEVPYCGGRYTVEARIERIINEQTGEMMHFKNPCIVLAGVYCRGEYSSGRLMCPRRILAYWREAWLERVPEAGAGDPTQNDSSTRTQSP